uniref:Uncharacterized protein n=1 Tax=Amphimedon queenslandica TaxID=400682 RepID=A0A1X7TWJ7_AMPQE
MCEIVDEIGYETDNEIQYETDDEIGYGTDDEIDSDINKNLESMFTVLEISKERLMLGGHSRCDSPGFSAKYGSDTFMELEYNAVLHMELV